jgi:DNA-binding Lrp family transcriptional regulator
MPDDLDRKILDRIQEAVPLVRRPFDALGEDLGVPGEEVLARVQRMRDQGIVRRLGPILEYRRWNMSGVLVAANADPKRLEDIRNAVTAYPEISHAYLRDHPWNFWFTVVAEDLQTRDRIIADVAEKAGLRDVRKLERQKTYKLAVRFKG